MWRANTGSHSSRGRPPAGGAICQYALKSGTMIVNATDVASDTFVSADRASTDKPTASAVGS